MATTVPALPREALKNFEYAHLKQLVTQADLLARQPAFYVRRVSATLAGYGAVMAVLAFVPNPWVQAAGAIVLAFVYGQVGLLGHDACHYEIVRSARTNWRIAYVLGNLLTGVSYSWWTWNHNSHHIYSNQPGRDPQMNVEMLAFTEPQAAAKVDRWGFILRTQQRFAIPLMCLLGLTLRTDSVSYTRARNRRGEIVGLAIHWVLYFAFLLRFLGAGPGLLFCIAHQALYGLYVGTITSPNHWGMPLAEDILAGDFLRQQAITSRNIRGGWLLDVWLGGLNYQIEPHLFPTMARNNLRKAEPLVRDFCLARGIPYHQVGFWEGWHESLGSLADISASVRALRPAAL